MNKIFSVATVLWMLGGSISFAQQVGNGGDLKCDARIRAIALNIQNWIADRGAEVGGLNLSTSLFPKSNPSRPYTIAEYNQSMLRLLHITLDSNCVRKGDPGYPVKVGQNSKICTSFSDNRGFHIKCDEEKFLNLNKDEEIQQIHHEFATNVPGLETDSGPISTYRISTQLSDYTETVLERRLIVTKRKSEISVQIEKNEQGEFVFKFSGGKGTVAEEIYQNLKNGNSKIRVLHSVVADQNVYITDEIEALSPRDENYFVVKIPVRGPGPLSEGAIGDKIPKEWLDAVNSGSFVVTNSDLSKILAPLSNDSAYPTARGKFIQCLGQYECRINVNKLVPQPNLVESKQCELSINKIISSSVFTEHLKYDGNFNVVSSVILIAKVREDLKDKVLAVHFGGMSNGTTNELDVLNPYYDSDYGHYIIELPTVFASNGGTAPASNYGYFRLELNDGRNYIIKPKNAAAFTIDYNFERHSTQKVEAFEDKMNRDLKTTADLYDKDGSARYVNPYKCP